jgi:hypothetical protein
VVAWADSSEARLEQQPRREEDSALGAEIEEHPRQRLPAGRSMALRGALAGMLVCRPPVRGHGYTSVLGRRQAAASVSWSTSATAGRARAGR